MGDPHMGLQARLMSQAMRKLTSVVSRNLSTVVFINQIRMKIGVVFGNPETTTGGQALKFYASVRLDIRRIGQLKDGEQVVGSRTRVKVVKNKVAPPFREAEFDVRYGVGVDRLAEALDLGVERGHRREVGGPLLARRRAHRAGAGAGRRVAAGAPRRARLARGPHRGGPLRAARSRWPRRRSGGAGAGASLRAERPVLPAEGEVEAARRGRVLGEPHPQRDLRRAGEAGGVPGGERGAQHAVLPHPQGAGEQRLTGAAGEREERVVGPPPPPGRPRPRTGCRARRRGRSPGRCAPASRRPAGARPRQSTSSVRSWVTGSPCTRKRPSSSMDRPEVVAGGAVTSGT